MVTRKNDEAVSPVIGVILMVAITVILAAVIAAFVFGMSGNISKTKTVAFTAQKIDSQNITLVNNGGQDAQNLVKITITTDPANTACTATPAIVAGVGVHAITGAPCVVDLAGSTSTYLPVGTTVKMTTTGNAWSVKTKVTIVGTFSDGSDYVLMDTTV
jgi:flagellin-like protein